MTTATLRPATGSTGTADMSSQPSDRFRKGLERLRELDGDLGDRLLTSLADIAPDFARYVVEFPFGDIYTRPGLDLRTREIATIAALTALGYAPAQLKVHIEAAINVGCTQREITEVIMQMAVYAGFPAALNALAVLKEVVVKQSPNPAEVPAC
jgi:4-carboxymuconolactone decarboxylase